LREQEMTVLLVEQNLHFALDVADWVAVMDRGEIQRRFARSEITDVAQLGDMIIASGALAGEG
jgi:ABC-type branched-subunit amino acid transport system ATPase component